MVTPIVLAEVSDKIPGKGAFIIVCAIFVCTVSFFAVRRRLWPMLLEFTIIAIGTVMLAREFLLDRLMRDAVIAEQGVSYFIIAFVSLILPVITGIKLYVTRRKIRSLERQHAELKSMKIKRKHKILAAVAISMCALAVMGSGLVIRAAAKGRTYSDVSLIPYRRVGVLLGCSRRLSDGRDNIFFSYRVAAAIQLFRERKIDYLIVSGDNHVAGYDEPTEMKRALIKAGIPPENVYCDFAGFRTLDSVVRAKDVFGQTNITIVSQEFHNQRAIFIAQHEGVDAIGFNAKEVDSYNSLRTRLREQFARVKTVLDLYLLRARPRFGGPKIMIGQSPKPPSAGDVAKRVAPEK